ncbi:transglycosylase domain-containing protein [Candidatus Microgenomates bacterium]|nr:transglycosylase domain-containing protein [Candidatus Microgenomates bacterium]
MARKRAGTTSLTPYPLKVVLLLIQFILVKIGSIPLNIVKSFINIINIFIKSLLNLKLSRHRGRPRTTPFIPFYLRRLNKNIWAKIPLKIKASFAFIILVTLVFLYTSFILTAAYQLPSPDRLITPQQPLTTEFYDRSGKLLYRLYEGRNRYLVKLEDLPVFLIQATIAIEDKNFYRHPGFDPLAIARAVYYNVAQGYQEGASTITQQLIKNSLLTPEKTISRKIKEIILAFWAERIYSKNQILQMYFNEAPYGGPAWGIEAASQTYFGKGAKDLDLSESAFLAGLPASPTQFSPYGTNPTLSKIRQEQVLQRMLEEGYITQTQKEQALSQPLALRPPVNNIQAPHFVFYVRDLLAQKYGLRVISQGGLKIQTSLDLSLQQEVEKIVSSEIDKLSALNVKNGAAMVLDAKTGQILAMMGSRDYRYPGFGNFNVTLAIRQPGSSIKPITYATAFKKGFSPGNTILDTPAVFKDQWGNSYAPVNYDGRFRGPVSIRQALASSFNVPAVKMLATIGLDSMIQTAKDLGITTFDDSSRFGLSLTLGGGDVRMIDMMGVYATLSQLGVYKKPTPIIKVTDSSGNILEEYKDEGKQVLEEGVVYLITNILSDDRARSLAFGSNSLLNLGPNVAVKTGTSDKKRDNLTFGYTTDFVVGVWVGNPDNSPMNPQLTSGITGAAPIWNKIAKIMLSKIPSKAFTRPEGIIEISVDGRKDLAIAGNIPKGLVRVKPEGDKLIFSDSFSSYATSSAQAAIKNGLTN